MAEFTKGVHDSFFPHHQSHRLLEDAIPPNDSEVLKNTFMVYGSILICIFLFFCFVRQKFPRPYKLRSWVEDLKVNTLIGVAYVVPGTCCRSVWTRLSTYDMMRDIYWGARFEAGSASDASDGHLPGRSSRCGSRHGKYRNEI
jgi:hypothetical protein